MESSLFNLSLLWKMHSLKMKLGITVKRPMWLAKSDLTGLRCKCLVSSKKADYHLLGSLKCLAFLERKSNKWRISSKTNLATLMLTNNVPCKHISLFFFDETYKPFGFQGNPAFIVSSQFEIYLLLIVFCYFCS